MQKHSLLELRPQGTGSALNRRSRIRLRVPALAIFVIAIAGCSTVPVSTPTQIANASVRYYDVVGSSAPELRAELNAKGPREGGRGFDAYTNWYFRWNWPGYGTNDCDLKAAQVHATIDVTFPRWTNSASAEPALRERWQRYVDALARHENGHIDLAIKHRVKILDTIRSSTCAEADSASRQAVQRLNAASAEYDQKTNHGRKEGTVFP